MANLLGGILSERARAEFVGREDKMEALLDVLEKGGPLVVHVHGIAGIGKTTLLEAFAARARHRGVRVVLVDCRAVEPTARGFLSELSGALGEDLSTVEDASRRLASFAQIVVIALDTYEAFRLLDTWIRQVFVPSLPVNTRLVLAGRNPPSPAPGGRHRAGTGSSEACCSNRSPRRTRSATSKNPGFHRSSLDGSTASRAATHWR